MVAGPGPRPGAEGVRPRCRGVDGADLLRRLEHAAAQRQPRQRPARSGGWPRAPALSAGLERGRPAASRCRTRLEGVPIPAGALPDPALDAHMTIIDRAANCEYDLYGAYMAANGWHAIWANSTRLDGSGVYPRRHGTEGLRLRQRRRADLAAGAALRPHRPRSVLRLPVHQERRPGQPGDSSDGRSDSPGRYPRGRGYSSTPASTSTPSDWRPTSARSPRRCRPTG